MSLLLTVFVVFCRCRPRTCPTVSAQVQVVNVGHAESWTCFFSCADSAVVTSIVVVHDLHVTTLQFGHNLIWPIFGTIWQRI